MSYPERLAAIDLEPLELRRLRADLILYYKCFNNLVALPCSDYFCVSTVTSQTRTGGNRLIRPICTTNHYQNDFFNRCITCWNFLPHDVVASNSLSQFKCRLTTVNLRRFLHCNYF